MWHLYYYFFIYNNQKNNSNIFLFWGLKILNYKINKSYINKKKINNNKFFFQFKQ